MFRLIFILLASLAYPVVAEDTIVFEQTVFDQATLDKTSLEQKMSDQAALNQNALGQKVLNKQVLDQKVLDQTKLTSVKPKISIVIDDLGDNSVIARQMTELPANLTMAILPKTPHAKTISKWAAENGHEVIMHLPMEAISRPDLLGPGALFSDMSKSELTTTIMENAQSIPNLVGLNNHMGSRLTQDEEKMAWVMSLAKSQNWYFLDSKTSESSVAEDVARTEGIPSLGRDIFLDHHLGADKENLSAIIENRMKRALRIAKKSGQVVIICHPYPETLAFLKSKLPTLVEEFEFVKASQLTQNNPKQIAMIEDKTNQSKEYNR